MLLTPVHFLFSQGFLKVLGPPNLGLSLQNLHTPQSSPFFFLIHPSQILHRGGAHRFFASLGVSVFVFASDDVLYKDIMNTGMRFTNFSEKSQQKSPGSATIINNEQK